MLGVTMNDLLVDGRPYTCMTRRRARTPFVSSFVTYQIVVCRGGGTSGLNGGLVRLGKP